MKPFWSLLFFLFISINHSTSEKICNSKKVNGTTQIYGENPCLYEFEKESPDICLIRVRAEGPQVNISYQSETSLENNTTEILLNYNKNSLKIRSENGSDFVLYLTYEKCECEQIVGDYETTLNGTDRKCFHLLRNTSSTCQIEVSLKDSNCEGALEINGTTLITGCLSSTKRLDFLKEKGLYFVLFNFTGNLKLKQTPCRNRTNNKLNHLNLLQLPVNEGERRCSRVYSYGQFTLRAPFYGSGECVFRVIKSRASVCRLRLLFYWFDLGFGQDERCEGGFLDVDGYRFCGCQSGLLWTTGEYTFINNEAVIKYVNFNSRGNMFIQVTQEDCSGPPRRFKRYVNRDECLPYGAPSIDFPTHIHDVEDQCEMERTCAKITSKDGQISSAGYPASIPGDNCIQFLDSCSTTLRFDDFDLSYSPNCDFDFLIFDGTKYCGNSLRGITVTLKSQEIYVRRVGHEGRGYLLSFNQICHEETTTTQRTDEDSSEMSGREVDFCRKKFDQKNFIIDRTNSKGCVYVIHKNSKEVCGLEIEISDLDIPCGKETLHLDKQYYCGKIPKETFYLAFTSDEILFEHEVSDLAIGKFKINGRQQNCAFNVLKAEERISNCETILKKMTEVVTAPSLFPRPPQDLDCAYQILPMPGFCSVKLNFGKVDIGISDGCSSHYLMIENKKYCGNSLTGYEKVLNFSKENTPVTLRYKIGKDTPFLDWEFRYTQLTCPSA